MLGLKYSLGNFRKSFRWVVTTARTVTNKSKVWERKYKRSTRIELEKHWKKVFKEQECKRLATRDKNHGKEKFYCLSMFPYPSGRLHMGHVRVYTISDAFAHFYRMNGYNVIHPMGWDAFGLPAENAARDRNLDPAEWTQSNITYMKNQLQNLNLAFDWDREVSTCDPEYYKWTQYIFVKLFEAGLAYQKQATVNWDPVDETVLADEQVDENGCSWRSGAPVEKKYLTQWFFKTTHYAKSLLDSLDEVDENVGIKAMQRNRMGEIDGCDFNFTLHVSDSKKQLPLSVFCPSPEAVYGASHVVIQSKYKEELARQIGDESLASQLLMVEDGELVQRCYVTNPFTKGRLKLIVDNTYEDLYIRPSAVLAIPGTDIHAETAANKHAFPYHNVQSEGKVVNSEQYFGLALDEARAKILQDSKQTGVSNGLMSSSRLGDWLISRQRYWGTPIPIIHCPVHGCVAVPYKDLPIKLPDIKDITVGSGTSPLSSATSWVNTTCPKCGAASKRETDTMDTFVDSSWYFLRYADPRNAQLPFSKSSADETMPVNLYIGGKEHATLHLYYARFFSHFLADQGMHSHREPFKKILAQGIIKGLTHQIKSSGKYVHISEVDTSGKTPVIKATGQEVETSFQKMSKSKFNGVDPEEFVNEWGFSITRLYVLYAAAPFEDIHWDVKTDVIPGVMRWQLKVWTCVTKLLDARNNVPESVVGKKLIPLTLLQEAESMAFLTNKIITDVTNHYTKDCLLSACVTCLMTLAKQLVHASDEIVQLSPNYERAVCALVIMSGPLVPHFASELWAGLQQMDHKLTEQNWEKDVLDQAWPKPVMQTDLTLRKYIVKVDRHTCHDVRLPSEFEYNDVRDSVLGHKKVKKHLKGKVPEEFEIDQDLLCINISTTNSEIN